MKRTGGAVDETDGRRVTATAAQQDQEGAHGRQVVMPDQDPQTTYATTEVNAGGSAACGEEGSVS